MDYLRDYVLPEMKVVDPSEVGAALFQMGFCMLSPKLRGLMLDVAVTTHNEWKAERK